MPIWEYAAAARALIFSERGFSVCNIVVFSGIDKPIFTVQLVLVFTSSDTKYSRNISSNIAVFVCASIFGQCFIHAFHWCTSGKSEYSLCMGHNAINIISENYTDLLEWSHPKGKFWKRGSAAAVADECSSENCTISKLEGGLLETQRNLNNSKPFRRYSKTKLLGSQCLGRPTVEKWSRERLFELSQNLAIKEACMPIGHI